MRTLEFVLILILLIIICAMAVFTRLHIIVDGEWKSVPSKTRAVAEPDPALSQDMYSELPVTRMEFLVLLNRKLGLGQEYGSLGFIDISADFNVSRYIYPALKAGLIFGYSDNTFRPYDLITRNEAEIILARAMKRTVPPWYDNCPYLTRKQMIFMFSELADEQNKREKR